MLNISKHSVDKCIDKEEFQAFQMLQDEKVSKYLLRTLGVLTVIFFIFLFLPWTQNIRAKGYVTTLSPADRPQSVQTLIGGKIEKWYVNEGQYVNIGDTIIAISEVKEDYLDPDLLDRTNSQIQAKSESVKAYDGKINNLQEQIAALRNAQQIKLQQNQVKIQQTRLKIQSDSIELVASDTKFKIAKDQLARIQNLYERGIKSLTDLEAKRLSVQEAQAKVISYQNKINNYQSDLINLRSDVMAIQNEYADKIAKASSNRMSAMSDKYNAEATVNKLQSNYNAYEVRQANYYIKSPINGYVTKAVQSGIGEIIKNGEKIVSIMPSKYQLAVETYIPPQDMPLLQVGQKVSVQFDGWPSVVFSGWPNNSYGTFEGEVFAMDNFISDNGKYRILVAPIDNNWPQEVRVGGGARTITLLNDVKIGYELWRQLNGFPPDYYKKDKSEDVKSKIPLKKFK